MEVFGCSVHKWCAKVMERDCDILWTCSTSDTNERNGRPSCQLTFDFDTALVCRNSIRKTWIAMRNIFGTAQYFKFLTWIMLFQGHAYASSSSGMSQYLQSRRFYVLVTSSILLCVHASSAATWMNAATRRRRARETWIAIVASVEWTTTSRF